MCLINSANALTISETTIANETMWKDKNITVTGDINIISDGILVIDNTTIKFINNYLAENGLKVTGNGKVVIKNNSIFGTDDMSFGANILLFDDAEIKSYDSTFTGLAGDTTQVVGALKGSIVLYKSAHTSYFYNTTFKDSYKSINTYATDLTVINCTFDNITSTALGPSYRNFHLENSTFKNFPSSSYAMMPVGLLSGFVSNNYFENINSPGDYTIDLLYYNKNVIVSNNKLNNTMRAIVINGIMEDIIVENNYVYNNPSYGLLVGMTYDLKNITVRNNIGQDIGEGIVSGGHGSSGGNNENIKVYGNRVINQTNYGPAFSVQLQNSTVHDNIFQAAGNSKVAGLKTLNDSGKIKGQSSNVIFKNNSFDGYKYAMELHSGDNLTFIDNVMKNSVLYDIAFLGGDNINHLFINNLFIENKIFFDNSDDVFVPHWYLDVKVVDGGGNPIYGAIVNIVNINDSNYNSINMQGEKKNNFITNADGHTPFPENMFDSIVIGDYFQNESTKIDFVYNITAEKDGVLEHVIINPNGTFYRSNPNIPNNTLTIVLPIDINDFPLAFAGSDYTVTTGDSITFDGSASTDDNGITSYVWDFNASDGLQQDAIGATVSHVYGIVGTYTVTLTVTDGDGNTDSDTAIVTVQGSQSNSAISITPSSSQITPGAPFILNIPITPATPITGAQFDLLLNSSLATVTTVTEGNLLNQDGASTFFNSGTINNVAGTVTNVYGSIFGETSVSSQGSMATINMTAGSTTGYLNLNLTNIIISDADSNAAPYSLTNATILIDTAPVLGSIGAKSVDEEDTLAFTLSASDADGNSLTYSASSLPDGASFNTASGAFSWTPVDGQVGTYVVTFEVTDGYLSDSEAVTITVNGGNHAPVITAFVPADGSVFNEVDIITIDVTASDADGQALTYNIEIDGVTKSTTSSYAWETNYSSAGAHTIDVTVSDGIEQATDQHTITINNIHPRWDVNEDNGVNILDITIICQKVGTTAEAPYPRWDVNQDGGINVQDLTVTAYYFGETVA